MASISTSELASESSWSRLRVPVGDLGRERQWQKQIAAKKMATMAVQLMAMAMTTLVSLMRRWIVFVIVAVD